VVFQHKILRELSLAAGLWLTASAALAGPQSDRDMPLGPAALPPKGYVAFCERKPQDCGANVAVVIASAQRAQADRDELMAALGPNMPAVFMPAAVGGATAPIASAPLLGPATNVAETEPVLVDDGAAALADISLEAEPHAAPDELRMTPQLWSLLNRVNATVNGAIARQADVATYGVEDFWNTPIEDGRRAGDCEDFVLEKERALIAAGAPRSSLNIALVTTPWGENHAVLLVATNEGEYVLDNLSPWIVGWRSAAYHWVRRQVNGEAFSWVMIEAPTAPKRY